jgi:hypothetical protein
MTNGLRPGAYGEPIKHCHRQADERADLVLQELEGANKRLVLVGV